MNFNDFSTCFLFYLWKIPHLIANLYFESEYLNRTWNNKLFLKNEMNDIGVKSIFSLFVTLNKKVPMCTLFPTEYCIELNIFELTRVFK
jgi:hypothetical protein